jgi:hypothetical protein
VIEKKKHSYKYGKHFLSGVQCSRWRTIGIQKKLKSILKLIIIKIQPSIKPKIGSKPVSKSCLTASWATFQEKLKTTSIIHFTI